MAHDAAAGLASGLASALAELVADVDRDHRALADALAGRPTALPADEGLAALWRLLVVHRLLDPAATGLALLLDAAAEHPDAVAEHLTWTATADRVLRLPEPRLVG